MGTGIVLQAFGDASWPAFSTFASALPDDAPFNPSNRREGCLAVATAADGVDVCNGDSGTPLVRLAATRLGLQSPRLFELVGLVSYRPGCDLAKTPGAYTDADYFAEWVIGACTQL